MIYLDNATTSYPKPQCVIDAVDDYLINCGANPGRSWRRHAREANDMLSEARSRVASLFGVDDPDRVVFGLNSTECIKSVYLGFLHPGDHVVTSTMEHKSMIRPLQELESNGISHTAVAPTSTHGVDPAAIAEAITPQTVLVGITSVSNVTGEIMPVTEVGRLCQERSIPFMVDASQGAGAVDINVDRDGIDILVASGHKGLMGPQGTGFMYLSENVEVHPFIGHVTQGELLSWRFYERYEIGTLNSPCIAGLSAGIGYIDQIGTARILKHEQKLVNTVVEEIARIDGVIVYSPPEAERRTNIVAFNISDMDCQRVAEILDSDYDIAVRAGLQCATNAHRALGTFESGGTVRAAFSWFNTQDDADGLIRAVRAIASR